ncbi:DnaJ domain-containing protein [Flavobacterium sp. XS2P24]|uniref:DnaJ domain-containing protein n=1 Tax=Flavobacterium sp. XS2P24 TaxID=3041249 RepID=UPI0024A94EE4|nr:DnaJ domain-containing protein [Flavobacterium sp. XS2P24]MDI6050591.1 DnaJ domain-containing protein [Flavobacterium sp. XS2P24]
MFKNYYKILDINKTSSEEEIKIAFKKQAIKWHPDKNPNIDSTEKMQDINEAKLILLDPEARAKYDIEYSKFEKKGTNENQKSENKQYSFDDDILEKWIENARRQAVDLAKQTIKEIAELSVTATKAAGSRMLEMVIFYGIAAVIVMIIFKACL